uniref:RRM domain-containing protein n=1 Tax=Tetradesmus obliquus TaxID=3088 RepID=A0A383VEA1_TETOB
MAGAINKSTNTLAFVQAGTGAVRHIKLEGSLKGTCSLNQPFSPPAMPHRGLGLDETEALSGSFATMLTTQASTENFSGSLCAVSLATNEDDSTLTVVPVVSNVALSAGNPAPAADKSANTATAGERRRLFFAQAAADATEEHIKQWFSQYGLVESVQLFNEATNGISSGYGYVTMSSNEQAAAALAAVQQNPQLQTPVGFLNVSWPLDEPGAAAPTAAAAAAGTSPNPMSSLAANADRTLFFAKVPPTALASEVELLFGSFGKLAEVNLFRAWAGAKHSKGCGLITYVDRQCAAAAIAQLHGKYVFPGSDCPIVVEWMDLKKQRPVAPPPPADKPPLGCAHDAYKLLLSNIPLTVSEADLAAVLRQYGHVVQLAVAPDSSGIASSGHVWYATKQAADALQSRVKAEPVWLRHARTNQDLALAVKRARKPGMLGPSGNSCMPGRNSAMTPNGVAMSSSSNSSSSLLPLMHFSGGYAVANDPGAQLAQMQAAGLARIGSMDASMLGPDVMRLLPLQPLAGGMQPQQGLAPGYMAVDVCEAMLDASYDPAGLGLGATMPVHLQPSIASQMASQMALQRASQQQRFTANSQMCLVPSAAMSSGQHCMSSPANILGGLDEFEGFEGSFNMSLPRGGLGMPGAAQQQVVSMVQQPLLQQQAAGAMWQQQQQHARPQPQMVQMSQSQPLPQLQPNQQQHMMVLPQNAAMQMQLRQQQQQVQQQMPQQYAAGAGAGSVGGYKSIAVPIEAHEVHLIAENLVFFSARSGAQVTITSLPGAALAIMISGRPDQVAAAQSLLAAARSTA